MKKRFNHEFLKMEIEARRAKVALANAVGSTPQAVRTWCEGKNTPRYEKIQKIAEFLKVDEAELFITESKTDEQV